MVFEAKIRPEALYTWQGIQLWTTNIGFLEEVVKICKKRWKLASWPWSFFWVRVWSGPKNGTKKDWRCSQWWQSTNIHLGWSYIDLYKQTGIKEQQLPKRSEKIRIPNRQPFVTLTQYMIHHYHSMPHRGYMTWTNSSNSSCKTTINHHKSWGVGWAWPGILQLMALQFLMHINGLPIVICTGYYQGCFMGNYESMSLWYSLIIHEIWTLLKATRISELFVGPWPHWFGSTPWISGTAAAAVNGYEHILNPPYMIKDVSYWVNYELLRHHQKGDWEAEEQHALGWTILGVREE